MNKWDKSLREMEKLLHARNAITSNNPTECRPQVDSSHIPQFSYEILENYYILPPTFWQRIKYKIAPFILWLSKIGDKNV
jgi:hypothetical protein